MKALSLILAGCLSSCAHTSFFRDGKEVARFEGDMRNMKFRSLSDGSFEWSGDIDHSSATLAQGKAASDKITAAGAAAAASGIAILLK